MLVLRSGGDFGFRDVELIVRHIRGKWEGEQPRIVCMWDKVTAEYDLGNMIVIPLPADQPGTWSRIHLYSPEMERFRPFLYIDLDTAVINSLEKLFDLMKDESLFVTLEDFWQRGRLATGLMWVPANSEKIRKVWEAFKHKQGSRMDNFLRQVVRQDFFWQQFTQGVVDFKPAHGRYLMELPKETDVVCFHGKPRIFDVAEASISIPWVKEYVNRTFSSRLNAVDKVAVIIPYKRDRGWLRDALGSIPAGVQIIESQGDALWPANFNRALPQVTRPYVRWLHEDDMLTENSIEDSVRAMEEQEVDIIYGNAEEFSQRDGKTKLWRPKVDKVTLENMLIRNQMHSAALLYRRDVFDRVGLMNESADVYSFEEYEYNVRCLKAGMKVGYVDATLGRYRRHPQQIVQTVDKRQRVANRNKFLSQYKSN